jgi:hypothetical protein
LFHKGSSPSTGECRNCLSDSPSSAAWLSHSRPGALRTDLAVGVPLSEGTRYCGCFSETCESGCTSWEGGNAFPILRPASQPSARSSAHFIGLSLQHLRNTVNTKCGRGYTHLSASSDYTRRYAHVSDRARESARSSRADAEKKDSSVETSKGLRKKGRYSGHSSNFPARRAGVAPFRQADASQ